MEKIKLDLSRYQNLKKQRLPTAWQNAREICQILGVDFAKTRGQIMRYLGAYGYKKVWQEAQVAKDAKTPIATFIWNIKTHFPPIKRKPKQLKLKI